MGAADLKKSFWAKAVNTTYYVISRSPLTVIKLKTPMEMWTGKPADYLNLHIFRSPAYMMYNLENVYSWDMQKELRGIVYRIPMPIRSSLVEM